MSAMPRHAPVLAYIGLGSNLEAPVRQLEGALEKLKRIRDTRLLRVSRFYRTRPVGIVDQPDFVNAVAEISTTLEPRTLLDVLFAIENLQGRKRESHWGPRTLDLDLLLYDSVAMDSPRLQLPHPRMHERAFVLAPLADIDDGLEVGEHGTVRELLEKTGRDGVEALGFPSQESLRTNIL